jgi:hypothetical protein
MSKSNYVRRGNLPDDFMSKLSCFKYLVEISNDPTNLLDLQYRGNSINVYYKGGSLLKLSGTESIDFSEKYYLIPSKYGFRSSDLERLRKDNYEEKLRKKPSKKYKEATQQELEYAHIESLQVYKELIKERDNDVQQLKNSQSLSETKSILKKMTNQMDLWKANKQIVKDERSIQQYISIFNKKFDNKTNFIVIDIEYALSSLSKYCKEGVKWNKQPRIDILAIDRNGQLYVMELKYGMKSVDLQKAGAIDHINDFYATVGHKDKWEYFMKDLEVLFNRKKKEHIIEENVKLDTTKPPCFAFIIKCFKDADEVDFQNYLRKKEITETPTLYLPIDDNDGYPEDNYKLNSYFIHI